MKSIRIILRKEWMEVFRNRMVIFTVAFLPLIMTAIPLAILYSMQGPASAAGDAASTQLPKQITDTVCSPGMNGPACIQAYIISQFMMLFMLIPVAIPGAIAAYSVVGEKTNHSLEPLLATPISTIELLAGKCLAAVIPAVIATYAGYGAFLLGAWIIVGSNALPLSMLDARWLIAVLVVGPLLAILAVTFAIMVSSRVNDPRVAEQISMIIIVPILGGFFGQVSGLFILNRDIILATALVMAVLDAGMLYLATKTFERESILTSWR
jgi:ABC-2 type transport system permease protein